MEDQSWRWIWRQNNFNSCLNLETELLFLQCDAPYRGHPTNIFYKLANQGTRI